MSTTARFTVGKLDAGLAILLTHDNHLIEFPSLLLPAGITTGSIVTISVMRDPMHERQQHFEFRKLQDAILAEFGTSLPTPPKLTVHAITQTGMSLVWSPLQLQQSTLRRIEVFRDGKVVKSFIADKDNMDYLRNLTWTKVGGLDIDKEYEFYIRLRTSAGMYESNRVKARTHTMDNMSGIKVAFGEFERGEREEALEKLKECLKRIGASWMDEGVVPKDTTHLLARLPKGTEFDEATKWNIPIVRPEWVFACEQKKRLQPAAAFYLRQSSTGNGTSSTGVVRSISEL